MPLRASRSGMVERCGSRRRLSLCILCKVFLSLQIVGAPIAEPGRLDRGVMEASKICRPVLIVACLFGFRLGRLALAKGATTSTTLGRQKAESPALRATVPE
jgi:hypothetical protein